MIDHQVHLAIQIVPLAHTGHPYPIIDKAIEVIERSGLRYEVGPMETVVEGKYNEVMDLARQAQEACLIHGAGELVVTMKLHIRKDGDITWEEKMEKHSR